MLRTIALILTITGHTIFAQVENSYFGAAQLKNADDFAVDEYGEVYVYRNSELSYTKYFSDGAERARLQFAVPFAIPSVQNPLKLMAFSLNAQEIRFFDQNLALVQKIPLPTEVGSMMAVFTEDPRYLWLIDNSSKRLIQYDVTAREVVSATLLNKIPSTVKDLLIHDRRAYILSEDRLTVLDLRNSTETNFPVSAARKLRREGREVLVIGQKRILALRGETLDAVFNCESCRLVDKNNTAYFGISDNKLYLYPIKKAPHVTD